MELTITKQDFAAAIATPFTAIDDVFNRCQPLFAAAQKSLEKAINYTVAQIDVANAQMVKDYICLLAFYNELPQMDLILTPTGFGIVSNNTLAPASKERVENLKANTLRRTIETKYLLLDELFATAAYVDAQTPDSFILLWSQYKALAGETIDVQKFDTLHYKFRSIETKLARLISMAELVMLRDLCARQWLPTWTATAAQKEVIEYIELFVIGRADDLTTADEYLPRILSVINDPDNAADFPSYVASSEYVANNMPPYENAVDKPTFFFS